MYDNIDLDISDTVYSMPISETLISDDINLVSKRSILLFSSLISILQYDCNSKISNIETNLSSEKINPLSEDNNLTIYPAAALFNGRQTFYNIHLTEILENEFNYNALLPQRNGFEFGNLQSALAKYLPDNEIEAATQDIIYYLDMGKYIPESDVIIANLDDVQDEGVMVEISYAQIMGKTVICTRTDVRSPYGTSTDELGGIHFFPAYQCDEFIKHYMPAKSTIEANQEMCTLAEKINTSIEKHIDKIKTNQRPDIEYTPQIENTIKIANLLFDNIEDIHSEKGLSEIAKRYVNNKELIDSNRPDLSD